MWATLQEFAASSGCVQAMLQEWGRMQKKGKMLPDDVFDAALPTVCRASWYEWMP